jgi:hypothetical protein
VALIEDEATAKHILAHLGLDTAPPRGGTWRSSDSANDGVDPVEDLDGLDPPTAFE